MSLCCRRADSVRDSRKSWLLSSSSLHPGEGCLSWIQTSLPQEEMQMAKGHVNRSLLIITGMQIKTPMRYHLTSVRRPQVTRAGEDAEKRGPLYTLGGSVNRCSHSGKPGLPCWFRWLKKKKKKPTCNAGDPGSIPGLGRSPEGGYGNHSSILA